VETSICGDVGSSQKGFTSDEEAVGSGGALHRLGRAQRLLKLVDEDSDGRARVELGFDVEIGNGWAILRASPSNSQMRPSSQNFGVGLKTLLQQS
jgi:hypothetical protein